MPLSCRATCKCVTSRNTKHTFTPVLEPFLIYPSVLLAIVHACAPTPRIMPLSLDEVMHEWGTYAEKWIQLRLKQTQVNLQQVEHRLFHPEEELASLMWDQYDLRLTSTINDVLRSLHSHRMKHQSINGAITKLASDWRDYQWTVRRHPNVYASVFQGGGSRSSQPERVCRSCLCQCHIGQHVRIKEPGMGTYLRPSPSSTVSPRSGLVHGTTLYKRRTL